MENEFVRVFMAILPRIFTDADSFDGMHWHTHGIRRPNGDWYGMQDAFPYPRDMAAPDVCTMAGWTSIQWTHTPTRDAPSVRQSGPQ